LNVKKSCQEFDPDFAQTSVTYSARAKQQKELLTLEEETFHQSPATYAEKNLSL
tara:strand:+ start:910 stop:1071 length:162 start_codon:yes stop_codon:yes gene_type:complete